MKKIDIINSLISYIGIGIMFLLTMIRANIFTVEEIGIYSYILGIAAILSSISNFGIQKIILKFYNENENNNFLIKVLGVQTIIYVVLGTVCLIIGEIIGLDNIKVVILLAFTLVMILNIDMIAMVKGKSTKSNLYQKIYFNILDLFILGVLFFLKSNIYIYIYIYIILRVMILFLMTLLVKKDIFFNSKEKITNKRLKKYFNYGLFIMINVASTILINTIDKVMLKNYINFRAVGIYTISLTVGNVIGVVGIAFSRSMPPKISKYLFENNKKSLEKIYKENLKYQIYIGLFSLACLIIFSKEILALMGEEYIDGYIVLILIAIGQMINLATGMCGTIIALSRYYKYEAYFNFLLLFTTVITNMIFIPIYGIEGAAFATALTLILINVMKMIYIYIKFKIHPYKLQNLKYIIAAIIISTILYTIKQFMMLNIIKIIFISILSFGIYDLILYLLKEKDLLGIKLINRLKKKKRI